MAKKLNSAKLKKRLWLIFSQFIRLRDSSGGFGVCIACDKRVEYPNSNGNWHAGHYYPRSTTFSSMYFDEMNVHGSCSHCNLYLSGNIAKYREGIIKRYGQDKLDDLEARSNDPFDPMIKYEYQDKIDHYKKLVKELKKERGIK